MNSCSFGHACTSQTAAAVCVAVRALGRIVSHKPTHGTRGGDGCRRREKGGRETTEDRVCTTAKSCDLTPPAAGSKYRGCRNIAPSHVCARVLRPYRLYRLFLLTTWRRWALGDEQGTTHTCRDM